MGKSDWSHIFTFFHVIGFGMIMTLPVSAIMLQGEMGRRDFGIVSKLGVFLGRMDRVAQVGALVLLLSGIGQMWAHDITFASLQGQYQWLGAKIILFAVLVVNGVITAGPGIRRRVRLLLRIADQSAPTAEQEVELERSANFMKFSGIPQIILLIAILVLVAFGYRPGF